jgi:NADPH:quinone reductase-like Zn-dependent oxidoreductase
MKAFVRDRYGVPDVLELREVDRPALVDDGVLVRVRAFSVNPYDWHAVTGVPYIARLQMGLRKPKTGLVGVDFAGTVEAVGNSVEHVRPGDDVYGGRNGAFAEYVCARNAVARKPANLTFEEAAGVPMAGITALQAIRDKGRLQPGQKVVVNGASGGVGTFAVQIAKALGGDVTAICSTRNVATATLLGADRVVDYTRDDFTRDAQRYDLMIDVAGNRSWAESKRVLADDATVVVVGGPKTNRWIASLGDALSRRLRSGSRHVVAPFVAALNAADLDVLCEWIEAGTVKPVVERTYVMAELREALGYVGEGHSRGKIVVTV